jgi:3'-phosphoadenosine 5'-phosphosulfate sulfotransferase (PAPS reductase)/FAD synthetase
MPIKIVVPISGGKDSQACLKLALRDYPPSEILGLFCDTQFEHPMTYQHIDRMREMYGVEITRLCAGNVPELVRKYGRFPGGNVRFCTDRLKLRPSRDFYRQLVDAQGGFEVWYGMRSDESPARAKRYQGKISEELYHPHEVLKKNYPQYLGKKGVRFRLPVLDWSTAEIFELLAGEENPLYALGSKRVGCFPCLAAGDPAKEHAFNQDDFGKSQREIVAVLERDIGKNIFTSKGGIARNADFEGCAICAI